MYDALKHAHSGLRWVVLVLLIMAIVNGITKAGKQNFTDKDRKLGLFAMIFCHIQLLLGLIIYFIGPKGFVYFQIMDMGDIMKNAAIRFHAVEHIVAMILGIVLITIGYSKTKRAKEDAKKFKSTWIFYSIGLIVILSRIPWPFMDGQIAGGWF